MSGVWVAPRRSHLSINVRYIVLDTWSPTETWKARTSAQASAHDKSQITSTHRSHNPRARVIDRLQERRVVHHCYFLHESHDARAYRQRVLEYRDA